MASLLGTFEQIVLLTVSGLADEAYGRAVLRGVQRGLAPKQDVSAGAVYATLDRLEAQDLLVSRLEQGTEVRRGRARRYYSLTGRGAEALNESRRVLDALWAGVRWPVEVSV